MFIQLFKYELRHSFRQLSTRLLIAVFFVAGFGAMAIGSDMLGERNIEKGTELFANSHLFINSFFKDLNLIILVLLPAVIGNSVYRDIKHKVHFVLFSYPFSKSEYLSAKFLSSFLTTALIISAAGLGLWTAEHLPFVNEALLGKANPQVYFRTFFVYVFPNIFIFGIVIFTVVFVTRNIYAGFVSVVLIVLLRAMIGSFLGSFDNFFLVSVFDPYGEATVSYATRYWTLQQRNLSLIPINTAVIFNRLFWFTVAGFIFWRGFRRFELEQNIATHFNLKPSIKKSKKYLFEKPLSHFSLKANLPKVHLNFSIFYHLSTIWHLSVFEFNYLFRSRSFRAVLGGSIIFMFILLSQVNPEMTTRIQPLTQVMLFIPTFFFSMVIVLLTFLYAGVLIHRSRVERIDSIIDATPVSDSQLLFSKFIALIKMQVVLLTVIMVVGIGVQAMRGYYDFEIVLYFFDLYVKTLPGFLIWTFLALFVQTLLPNPMLGAFLLLLIFFGVAGMEDFGIKDELLQFNSGSLLEYSDLDKYGSQLPAYFLLKLYWFLFGIILLFGARLFWIRGLSNSFRIRLTLARKKFFAPTAKLLQFAFYCTLFSFLGVAGFIFYEKNIRTLRLSPKVILNQKYQAEVKYSKFRNIIQPRISGAKINMHLFPDSQNYQSDGTFTLKNKSNKIIDTILINTSFDDLTNVNLNRSAERIISDSVVHFEVFKLKNGLLPGDSLQLTFTMKNKPNLIFQNNSQVKNNGTFFLPNFPTVGYHDYEISNNDKRKEFGLLPKIEMMFPPRADHNLDIGDSNTSEKEVLQNYYAGKNIDFINFEATVSTSAEQIALAPGKLQKEWAENGRRFFHYKTNSPIRNGIVFNSGRFEIKKERWNDVDLEIYYHPSHKFNLESMMNGMKATLEYCTENFAPYPFDQMRIIEFPKSYGRFAQSFAGTIPYSEFAGFITNVDTTSKSRYDSPFRLTTHEMSHQWWGHSVAPANVRGSKLITEGLAEYTSLKILEKHYGKDRMRTFLKLTRDAYLRGRTQEQKSEQPLWCAEHHKGYLNYNKGALAFYLLSDYLGEKVFNNLLKTYVDNFRLQSAPYSTSINLIDIIRSGTPDSMQYLINDLFEKSVLYDNRAISAQMTKLKNGTYQINFDFLITKFQTGSGGKRIFRDRTNFEGAKTLTYRPDDSETSIYSLPLEDYVEIGVYSESGKELYLRKHKITDIKNKITITTDELPKEVEIDPMMKLIDVKEDDNRIDI